MSDPFAPPTPEEIAAASVPEGGDFSPPTPQELEAPYVENFWQAATVDPIAYDQKQLERAGAMEVLFKASKFKDATRNEKVYEVAGALGTPARVVDANLEGFQKAAELARFQEEGGGVRFVKENPILADILFRKPEAAIIGMQKPTLDYVAAMKAKFQDAEHVLVDALAWFDKAVGADPALKARLEAHRKAAEDEGAIPFPGDQAMLAGEAPAVPSGTGLPTPAAMDEEIAKRTKFLETPRPTVIDIGAHLEGWEKYFGAWQWTPEGGVSLETGPAWARYGARSKREQIDRSSLGNQIAALEAKQLGRYVADMPRDPEIDAQLHQLRMDAVDLKNELVPTDFGARGVETLIGEAINLWPSQVAALSKGAQAGVLGGAATGLLTLAGTRNPARAVAAAGEGFRIGSRVGAVLGSYSLEKGNAYLDMTEAGIEPRWALPAAEAYGWGAAWMEVGALGVSLKMLGPIGDALLAGSPKAFAKAMVRDVGLRSILADAGKRWAKGVAAESAEEMGQNILQDIAGYAARAAQDERFAAPDIQGSLEAALEVGIRTGIGTAIMGFGGAGVNVASQLNHVAALMVKDQSIAASTKTGAILGFLKDSSLGRAHPEVVSELIQRETAKSGTPVTSIFVAAEKFIRLFQKEDGKNGAWETAALELGGQALVDKLKVAAAEGGKIEVPLEEFAAKWNGKPIAEALALDMTVRRYADTTREIFEKQASFREQARALADEYLKNNPPPKSAAEETALESMLAHEASVGLKDPEQTRQAMAVWRAMVHTMAKVWKKPAAELFAQFQVGFDRRRAAEAGTGAAPTQVGDIETRLRQEGREWTRVANGDGTITFYSTNPDGTASRVDTFGERRDDGAEGVAPNIPARPSEPGRASTRTEGAPSSSDIQGIRDQTGAPITDGGTLNAGAVVERLFQTEDWQGWFEVFRKNALVKKTFTAKALEQLRAGMEHARLIFGRAYEERIMPEEYIYEFDDEGNVKLDKKTGKPVMLNPLRENEDFDESFDLSTICPRQDTFTNTVHALERRLGKILTPTQRHLIGVMIQQHGDQPACWYCYGQAARNAFDQTIGNDARIARAYVAMMKRTKGKATPEMLAPLFEDDALGFHYTPTGILGQYLEANWKQLVKDGVPGEVELRDMTLGYAPAKIVSHRGLAAAAGSHAQAATKANQPKQWAKLTDQIISKPPEWVARKNARAGLRFNSQTDIRGWHLIDLPQAFAMAQAIGLFGHVYTKERDFLLIFGKTGMKFNLSAAFITKAGVLQVDSRGKPVFDSVFGMAGEDIERFIVEYPQVAGGMLMAHNDAALWAGLDDERIHQIIPYHKGKVSAPINFFEDARDYTDYQAEIWTRRGSPGKYFIRAPDGEWYKAGTPWVVTLDSGETISVSLGWSTDHSHHKSDQARYLEICEKVGCAPKFALSNKMGSPPLVVTKPDGTKTKLIEKDANGHWVPNHPEYMKLVRDVAREPQNQTALDASKINWQELHRAQKEWIDKGGDDTKADPELVSYVEGRILRGEWPEDKKMPSDDDIKRAQEKAKLAKTKQAKGLAKEIRDLEEIGKSLGVPGLVTEQEARLMAAEGPVVRGWLDKARDGVRRLYKIAVTEHANRSTFLHESAHVFLDMMGELAERPDAPARLKNDYAAALSWLGAADRGGITRDMEEKWARTFEAYLMSGKAPSLTLVRAFTRFSIWLKKIYQTITSVPGAELDPTITGIFDRLLATDQEIENVKQSMGLQQLWRSPEEANMTPDEWRAYLEVMGDSDLKAQERAMLAVIREQLRETEAWWKDEEANVQKQIGEEYDAQPGWLALRLLKLGETNGSPALEALKDLDLNEDAVAQALKDAGGYYPSTVKKKLAGKVSKKGVLTPDQLGEVWGLSGTEILRAIADLPLRDRYIREETAKAMAEQHGDIVLERDRLRELAADSLHEGPQLHYLMHEYDVLRQRLGQQAGEGAGGIPMTSMELAAAEIVDGTQLLEISEKRALGLERKASEEAFQKVAKGDLAGALIAKQTQILNMLIYRASQDARQKIDSFERLLEKQNDDKRRGYLGKYDRSALDTTDRILEALKVRAVPTDPLALKDRKDLQDLLHRFMLDGVEPAFDEEAVQKLLDFPPAQVFGRTGEPRGAWLNLTFAEMREIDAALRQMKKTASDAVHVMLGDQKIAVQALNGVIATESKENVDRGKQPGAESTKGWWWSFKKWAEGENAELSNPQLMVERLGPAAYKFLWEGYNATQVEEARLFKAVLLKTQEAWKALSRKDQAALARLIDPADLPFPIDVDRENESRNVLWLVMVLANMGNASNMERLLRGYDWTEQQVIDAIQKYLTHDQVAWVQAQWDLMDRDLYPAMAEVYRRVNGVLPKKIDARPLTLTIGGETKTYRGGYWPARYDTIGSRLGKAQVEGPMAKALGGQSVATTMNRSFTKARAEHFADVINLDWNVYPGHVFDLIHYVATDEFVRGAYRVMSTAQFQTTVRHALGEASNKELDAWLKIVAAGARVAAASVELRATAKAMGFLRSRFTMGVLGGSMQTMLGDLPAPLLAITDREVKARFMVPVMLQASTVAGWVQMRKHALEHSRILPGRRENWRQRTAEELAQPMKAVTSSRAKETLELAREAAWYGFSAIEWTTSTMVWEGRYRQERAAGLSHENAVSEADKAVDHLYPSHDAAKQATVVRSRSMAYANAFYSFFSSRYSQSRRTWHPAAKAWAETEGLEGTMTAARLSAFAFGQTVASLLVMNVLSELLSGRGPEGDEEDDPLYWSWILRKSVEGAFMILPFGGLIFETGTAGLNLTGKKRAINERASPVVSVAYSVGKAIQKASSEGAEAFDIAMAAGEIAALGLKLPVNQPKRTIKYLFQGENRSPAGIVSGVVYGERENQPLNPATMLGGRR